MKIFIINIITRSAFSCVLYYFMPPVYRLFVKNFVLDFRHRAKILGVLSPLPRYTVIEALLHGADFIHIVSYER